MFFGIDLDKCYLVSVSVILIVIESICFLISSLI